MKNFNQILGGLEKGRLTVQDKVSDGKFVAKNEKDAQGNLTGNEIVGLSGGRYSIRLLENSFLSGIQSFAVRNGFAEFGAEFVELIAEAADLAEVEKDFDGIKLDAFLRPARSFVGALLKANVTAIQTVTDSQAFDLTKAICKQKAALGISWQKPTDAQKAEVEKAIAERADARTKAAADALTAALTATPTADAPTADAQKAAAAAA